MKPISELVNDREACERIVSIFTMPGTVERVSFAPTFRFGGYVSIETIAFEIQVYSEGHLIILDGEDTVPYNPFAFVSLMNELGYGPEGYAIQVPREMVDITVCSDQMRTLTNGRETIVEPLDTVEFFDNGREEIE